MRCPHGDHELEVAPAAEHNVLTYGSTSLVRAECCGRPVRLARVQHLTVHEPYACDLGVAEDDWGKRFTA